MVICTQTDGLERSRDLADKRSAKLFCSVKMESDLSNPPI